MLAAVSSLTKGTTYINITGEASYASSADITIEGQTGRQRIIIPGITFWYFHCNVILGTLLK